MRRADDEHRFRLHHRMCAPRSGGIKPQVNIEKLVATSLLLWFVEDLRHSSHRSSPFLLLTETSSL